LRCWFHKRNLTFNRLRLSRVGGMTLSPGCVFVKTQKFYSQTHPTSLSVLGHKLASLSVSVSLSVILSDPSYLWAKLYYRYMQNRKFYSQTHPTSGPSCTLLHEVVHRLCASILLLSMHTCAPQRVVLWNLIEHVVHRSRLKSCTLESH
jgi:hypothetical protein